MRGKLLELCKLAERLNGDGSLPIVVRGDFAFDDWWEWRRKHGLGTAYMDRVGRYTVPMTHPPDDLDEALEALKSPGRALRT